MQITYREPSLAHSIDSILLFQTEGTGGWWMDALYQFYPQLDRADITLNPICPRFLKERRFDVFYRNSPSGALGMALHEIVHFLWFDRWNALFHDDPAEYETPHLKWIFSEMCVRPILGEPRLAERNPYYPGECVYEYFYTMTVGGRPVLETMEELFAQRSMDQFMVDGYRYCQEHEAEILRQMR